MSLKVLLSDFLKKDIDPYTLGTFVSRSLFGKNEDNEDIIYTYLSFKKSSKIRISDFNFKEYAQELTEQLNDISYFKN